MDPLIELNGVAFGYGAFNVCPRPGRGFGNIQLP